MKKTAIVVGLFTIAVCCVYSNVQAGLIITGVIDGPRSGGTPKAVELYATTDIADLSIYNVETPNNGGTPTGSEFELSGSASAGQYLYLASESTEFQNWFGFAPTWTGIVASINGDDNVMLYENGALIDNFGVAGVDGSGEPWEYADGWAYRNDGTGPDGAFVLTNWSFSGVDALDPFSSGTNADAGTPFGSYVVPEPSAVLLGGIGLVGLLGLVRARRKVA